MSPGCTLFPAKSPGDVLETRARRPRTRVVGRYTETDRRKMDAGRSTMDIDWSSPFFYHCSMFEFPSPVDFGTAHSTHMKPAEHSMSKLRVHNFAISLDGYGAGPRQALKDPLGVGGEELHGWYIGTRAFREINGKTGGTTGPDNDFAKRFGEGIGAYIMGRNMFGPVRGPWTDDR